MMGRIALVEETWTPPPPPWRSCC